MALAESRILALTALRICMLILKSAPCAVSLSITCGGRFLGPFGPLDLIRPAGEIAACAIPIALR